MHLHTRTLLLALVAATSLAVAAGTAAAAITPNPYATTSGTGAFTVLTPLGNGSCNLSAVRAALTGTTGGAAGSITGLTGSGCAGYLTAAQYSEPISFAVDRGAVTVGFTVAVTNIVGGRCVYRGTFRGSAAERATTFTTAGTMALTRTISGFCDGSLDTRLSLTLPGQSITWTSPPSGGLSPDPYSSSSGTGILGIHTVYGSAGCQLSGAAISATGIANGASGTITGFTASNCYGAYTRAAFNSNITFSAASGAVSANVNVSLTNVFGGTCVYGGTLTGSVPNGGYVLTVRGDLTVTRTVSGYCETPQTTTLGIALPGARISW